ncbi:MAG: hypothetical protein K5868_05075 [Lachnospiraceae bacterium]|nr:hypothetical protein [Lachnospiraceae bacterium]
MTTVKLNAKRIILFILIFVMLFCCFDYVSYHSSTKGYVHKILSLDGSRYGYDEVAPVLDVMGSDDGTTKLILGDSVANQMLEGFMGNDEDFLIWPVNRAITFAGQYILIKEYLAAHPNAEDVYVIVYSGSLASDVDSELAYQYLAMPFIINGYEDELDELVMGKLKDRFGGFFIRPEVLDYINESGVNRSIYLNAVSAINSRRFNNDTDDVVSDITADYLKKIYDMCTEAGVNIHLVSTPLCDTETRREECDRIRIFFEESGLDEMYPDYCNGFIFKDSEYFLEDEVHFKPEYKNREIFEPMLREMIGMDSKLAGLTKILCE